jgi:predicted site-specific integrase-resolvase
MKNTTPDEKDFTDIMDGQEVMQLFHVCSRTLQNWRNKGMIPYIKIGNRIHYYRSDIIEMIKKNTRRKGGDKGKNKSDD